VTTARIRLAEAADAEAVAAVYAPFVTDSVISFEAEPPVPDEMRGRIAATTVSHPWLVCELDDVVVGYAYAVAHRTRAAYRWSTDTSVYVDAVWHRRGIGRALYTSLLAILRAQGLVNACAGITLPNPASVGLHESVGFRPVGVYERIGHKSGRWHDVGWWQLALGAHAGEPDEPLPLAEAIGRDDWHDLLTAGERFIR